MDYRTYNMMERSDEWHARSHHFPIITEIDVRTSTSPKQEPRPQWKKAEWETVRTRSAERLQPLYTMTRVPTMVNYHQLNTVCGRTPPACLSLHHHFLSSHLTLHLVPQQHARMPHRQPRVAYGCRYPLGAASSYPLLYSLPLRHSQ
jgi:hypothetical protein